MIRSLIVVIVLITLASLGLVAMSYGADGLKPCGDSLPSWMECSR